MRHQLPPPRLAREGWAPVDIPKGAQRRNLLVHKLAQTRRTRFIPALPEHQLAGLIGGLAPDERKALDMIVETTDLLIVGDRKWFLVPAPPLLIDLLATFGAEFAECEWALEDEEETDVCGFDREGDPLDAGELDDSDKEAEPDNEPSFGLARRPAASIEGAINSVDDIPPKVRWARVRGSGDCRLV